MTGNEFGAQAFIQSGEILFILPHGDLLYHAKTNVPIGHYVPYIVEQQILEKINNATANAIHALGLDNCAVNLDFIEKEGEIFVLELSGRIGANGIPEMVSAYFNINYYKMVLMAALGIDVREEWNMRFLDGAVISRMIFCDTQEGTLKELTYSGTKLDGLVDMQMFAKPGSLVHKFENSSHCLGQYTVKAPTINIAREYADAIWDNLNIVLE